MGVLSGKDIYNSKYTTADIVDSSGRVWYVPIKYVIGDYFLADLDGQVYCFKLEDSRIKTYRHTLVKSFRKVYYSTDHYMPISASDNRALEIVLRENALPKMNMMLFNILKLLGKREKEEFTPHDLMKLVEEVSQHEDQYKERVINIKNYLSHLNIDEIVTPVRKVTEFIEGDLIATDPRFMGSIKTQLEGVDSEHKKVTNTPEKGKTSWIKIMLLVTIVSMVVFVVWWAYDSGFFNNIVPNFGFQLPGQSGGSLMDRYPTPEAAKAAIDRGELDYNSLSPDERRMIDNVEPPQASPTVGGSDN